MIRSSSYSRKAKLLEINKGQPSWQMNSYQPSKLLRLPLIAYYVVILWVIHKRTVLEEKCFDHWPCSVFQGDWWSIASSAIWQLWGRLWIKWGNQQAVWFEIIVIITRKIEQRVIQNGDKNTCCPWYCCNILFRTVECGVTVPCIGLHLCPLFTGLALKHQDISVRGVTWRYEIGEVGGIAVQENICPAYALPRILTLKPPRILHANLLVFSWSPRATAMQQTGIQWCRIY